MGEGKPSDEPIPKDQGGEPDPATAADQNNMLKAYDKLIGDIAKGLGDKVTITDIGEAFNRILKVTRECEITNFKKGGPGHELIEKITGDTEIADAICKLLSADGKGLDFKGTDDTPEIDPLGAEDIDTTDSKTLQISVMITTDRAKIFIQRNFTLMKNPRLINICPQLKK